MHKLLTALTIFTLLSLTLFAAAQDHDNAAPSLTIYNQNFFVARDHLTLDLKPGANHIDFAGVTAHLEPDSVILRDLTGRPLQILEQSYRADPISQEMLLSFYEGKTIDFQIQRGDKFETFPGKIIPSGYASGVTYINAYPQGVAPQPIVQVNGVLQFGLPGQPLFPALSASSILKPTLTYHLPPTQSGRSEAEISYVSAAMTWQPAYNLVLYN